MSTPPEQLSETYIKTDLPLEIAITYFYLSPWTHRLKSQALLPLVQQSLRFPVCDSPRRTAATGSENRWSMILIPEHWLLILSLL